MYCETTFLDAYDSSFVLISSPRTDPSSPSSILNYFTTLTFLVFIDHTISLSLCCHVFTYHNTTHYNRSSLYFLQSPASVLILKRETGLTLSLLFINELNRRSFSKRFLRLYPFIIYILLRYHRKGARFSRRRQRKYKIKNVLLLYFLGKTSFE